MRTGNRTGRLLLALLGVAVFQSVQLVGPVCSEEGKGMSESLKYEVYSPDIEYRMIYQGQEENGRDLSYNHCSSVAFFKGKFYVVWQGNPVNQEGAKNQKIYLSTSDDFEHWSEPVALLERSVPEPFVGPEPQKQPNLLNVNDEELWCIWHLHSGDENKAGVYLSVLKEPGGQWENRRIHHLTSLGDLKLFGYTAQNPVLLRSGRVICPLTFIARGAASPPPRYAGFLYTDDKGETWQVSNFISSPEDYSAMWEPFGYEQSDGRIRAFLRNISRLNPGPVKTLMTAVGIGAHKGEELKFDSDAQYSHMELISERPQVIHLSSGRYLLLHHDVYTSQRPYDNRIAAALFFSRSGADDFVAGPSFSRPDAITAYTQGIEHNGKIYITYSLGDIDHPRSIEGACIDPAPKPDRFYIWPRDKEILDLERGEGRSWKKTAHAYTKPRPVAEDMDGRRILRFSDGASAGVETPAVDLDSGDSLEVRLDVIIERVQEIGNLILCSFGDGTPIRIGMPANRRGQLYAFCADGWQQISQVPIGTRFSLDMSFAREKFTVSVDEQIGQEFSPPVRRFNPRLYFGDGYEVDYRESNKGSEFVVDMDTFKTRVKPGGEMKYNKNAGDPMAVIDIEEAKQYINSFCVTRKGTWIVSVTSGEIGAARVYVKRSEDKGLTWSKERIYVYDPHVDESLDTPADYDCEMGQLFTVPEPLPGGVERIYQFSIVRNIKQGTRFGRLVYTISEDDGLTWTGPNGPNSVYELDSPVYELVGHNRGWHLMAPPRRMSDGRMFLPMNASTDPKRLHDIRCEVLFMRSSNVFTEEDPAKLQVDFTPPPPHGIFVPLKGVPGESHGMEAQIVELSDHRLFTVMRTGNGCVYYSVSDDFGDTWAEAKPLRRDDGGDLVLNPNCACPLTKLSDGRYALLHCNNDGHVNGSSGPFEASKVRSPIFVSVGVENEPGREQPIRWSKPRLMTTLEGYQTRVRHTSNDLTYGLLHEEDGQYYHFYNARWESIQVNRIDPKLLEIE